MALNSWKWPHLKPNYRFMRAMFAVATPVATVNGHTTLARSHFHMALRVRINYLCKLN